MSRTRVWVVRPRNPYCVRASMGRRTEYVIMTNDENRNGCGPDYAAMAAAILKIANDLRERAARAENPFQLEQADRLEQIADRILSGAARRTT